MASPASPQLHHQQPLQPLQPHPKPPARKERPPSPPPTIFDAASHTSYPIGPLLGEGGFARCYSTTDPQGNRLAVKVVHKPSLKSSKQRAKLLSEIKIHKKLLHPGIVKFHHVFEDDENVYMIMEICENKTFVDMLKKRKRLTEPEVRYYMQQLLDAIRYMHSRGIIHRDIKLGNLFLARNMRLKIGDFGLAAEIMHDGERKKTICGTPNYIAPEVLFNKEGHSFEVDIWSFGIVIYTLIIGKPPFQTKDINAIYERIRVNNLEFPPNIPISDSMRNIIKSLLNSTPEHRPSIEQVLAHDFFHTQPIIASVPVSALTSIPVFESIQQPSSDIMSNTANAAGSGSLHHRHVIDAKLSHAPISSARRLDPALDTQQSQSSSNGLGYGQMQRGRAHNDHGYADAGQAAAAAAPLVTASSAVAAAPAAGFAYDPHDRIRHAPFRHDTAPRISGAVRRLHRFGNMEIAGPPSMAPALAGAPLSTTHHAHASSSCQRIESETLQPSTRSRAAAQAAHGSPSRSRSGAGSSDAYASLAVAPAAEGPYRSESASSANSASSNASMPDSAALAAHATGTTTTTAFGAPSKSTQSAATTMVSPVPSVSASPIQTHDGHVQDASLPQSAKHAPTKIVAPAAEHQSQPLPTTPLKEPTQSHQQQHLSHARSAPSPRKAVPSLEELLMILNSGLNSREAYMKSRHGSHGTRGNSNRGHENDAAHGGSSSGSNDPIDYGLAGQLDLSEIEIDHPDHFVTKWIDYSNKFGFGYQLRDGSVGVYFNDSTSIILASDTVHFEYLYCEQTADKATMRRDAHALRDYPQSLHKKVTLLEYFRNYMQENLYRAVSVNEGAPPKCHGLDYLTKYLRTKHGIFFRLSNQTLQLNLIDHTKLIISGRGQVVTYIDAQREMRTQSLSWVLAHGSDEVVDRLAYVRNVIQKMILKKSRRNGNGGVASPGAVVGASGNGVSKSSSSSVSATVTA